jgi:acyl-CoA thioesterase FadM
MARTKLELPDIFPFSTIIPIRITDINYGNHVGNDAVLCIIHEARMQFLRQASYTELNMDGVGMIMSEVIIQFKNELFYGDNVIAGVAIGEFSKAGFEFYYKLEKEADGKKLLVATARTSMVCYDYSKKKITAIPEEVRNRLESL